MAAELMLINPRRRRGRKSVKRRARVIRASRNPRKRRRRHTMSALQMKYFGKGHKRHTRRRHRRAAPVVAMTRNPRRRRHNRKFTIMRRNPWNFAKGSWIEDTLIPATFGALGGVATTWVFANYAPPQFRTGLMLPISELGLAALMGMGVGAVSDEKTGAMVGAGAMTVIIYQWLEDYLASGLLYPGQNITGNPLMGRLMPTSQRMGRFVNMGRIVNQRMSGVGRIKGMGYINPARQMGC